MANSARSITAAFQGRYEILETLGEGGFGKVYKAQQLATGQTVAMKVLRLDEGEAHDARERRVARFQREMQICSQIYHPNIVRLMDSGHTAEGVVFSVFEFVPGKNLAQIIAEEGRLDPVEARHLFLQVLDALACAHSAGIVHRDLKPANLMVTPTGARRNVLVLDFGIGALSEDVTGGGRARITMTNEFVGTPSYTAPEQLLGRPPTLRSDLYSWGLCFLESLSGKRVVDGGTTAEVVFKQLSLDPIPIPDVLVDHPLGSILRRATAKDAAVRDVTAGSLLRELEAYDVSSLKEWARPPVVLSAAAPTVNVRMSARNGAGARLVEGERRQVTAVCCVFHTGARGPQGVDVEELDQILGGHQEALAEIAVRHDGHVAGVLGDTVLFYFGHPVAREDGAQRAARAALAMAAEIARRSSMEGERLPPMEVRIGVHTGLVVGRESRDAASALGYVGTTPSLTSRLAALAAPGAILVSGGTRRLLRKEFAFDDAGLDAVDDGQAPTRLYALRGPRTSLGTVEVPMVGRAREIETLLEHWKRARSGAGQAVVISGEAGVGKSRLGRELRRRLADRRHGWLECRCTPDSAHSALYPIVELLDRTLDPSQRMPAGEKVEKLEAMLSTYDFDLAEAMPLFASLLSIPFGEAQRRRGWAPLDVSPARLGELTRNAVLSLLFEMAEKEPLVLMVEDAHWADSSTLDLFGQLAGEVGSARVLAIFTSRPELVPAFSRSEVVHLHLGRLSRVEVDEMAVRVTQGCALPVDVLDTIAARTDGVPLFVEELTRAMIEAGALVQRDGRYELVQPLSEVVIPATLRDSLVARFDRIGRAKETAQIAAAIGREFGFELLAAVSPLAPGKAKEDLDRLVAAQLVYRKRRLKSATYLFKHALVRDAAYASMLKRSQHQVHARIAEALERDFPEVVAERPDVVARHHAAGQGAPQAVAYALRAGVAALGRSAYAEALAHGRGALAWLDGIPDERARAEAELALLGVIAPALSAGHGHAPGEIGALLERSRVLIERLGESEHTFPLLWATVLHHYGRGELGAASDVARSFLDRSVSTQNRSRQVAAHALLGQCQLATGHLEDAVIQLAEAVRLYDPDADRGHAVTYGMDSRVYGLVYLGEVLTIQGHLAAALACGDKARAWARELDSRHVTCAMLFGLACLHHLRGERAAVLAVCDEMLRVVAVYGASSYAPMTELLRAWADQDLRSAEVLLAQMTAHGTVARLGVWASLVAELLAERGQDHEAIEQLDDRIARHDDGSTYYVPELLRLKGQILAKTDENRGRGKRCLREAVRWARLGGALLFELRATRALAELLVAEGRGGDARTMLEDVLGRFGDGEDHPDLAAARATLARTS
jgi:TOMM system kinase/cyclase fusion protein